MSYTAPAMSYTPPAMSCTPPAMSCTPPAKYIYTLLCMHRLLYMQQLLYVRILLNEHHLSYLHTYVCTLRSYVCITNHYYHHYHLCDYQNGQIIKMSVIIFSLYTPVVYSLHFRIYSFLHLFVFLPNAPLSKMTNAAFLMFVFCLF